MLAREICDEGAQLTLTAAASPGATHIRNPALNAKREVISVLFRQDRADAHHLAVGECIHGRRGARPLPILL